jgi:MFS family permease
MSNFPTKRVLKAAAIMAGILSFAYFISLFLSVVAILDVSLWSSAFANLLISAFFGFVMLFIAFGVLSIVIWFPVKWWRKKHPAATAIAPDKDSGEMTAEKAGVSPSEQFRYTISLFFGGLSAFLYLLYLVGRTYYESYLSSLGVPKGIVNYRLDDYVYFGAQIDRLVIVVTFTAILIGFLMFWFRRREMTHRGYKRWDFLIGLGYFLIFTLILAFFAFVTVSRSDLDNVPAVIFGILMACLGTSILLIIVLYDEGILSRITKGEIIRKIFVASVVTTLLVFPYMSAKAWGAFKGITAKLNTFPQVELCATQKVIDGIQWQPTGNDSFRSAEELYLIARTDDYLILKVAARPNDVYIVKFTDVLSTRVFDSSKKVR